MILQWLIDKWRGIPLGGIARSSKWGRTKRDYEIIHPKLCSVCGTKKKVELHHLLPFHLYPKLENDFNNLIWGCRDHHYFVYHLMDWSAYSSTAKEDAKIWNNKITNRIYGK